MIPLLNIPLPRPVTSLHQIELTSRCNLRCSYCPSPHLVRPKIDMMEETFLRALEWVKHFRGAGTQGELNLAGIGESTLHPRFAEWLPLAREAVGPTERMLIATNGVSFTEDIARAAAAVNLRVCVSLHRPEVAGPAVALATRYGVFEGVSADPSMNANDWAGQVQLGYKTTPKLLACPWMRGGWVFCLADGRISRCCLDATGAGVIYKAIDRSTVDAEILGFSPLTVRDDPRGSVTNPWKLCTTCYQDVNIVGYEQRPPNER